MGSNERKRRKFYQQLAVLLIVAIAGYYILNVYLLSALDDSRVCGAFSVSAQKVSPRI